MKILLSLTLILLLSISTTSSGGNSISEPELTVRNDLLPGNITDKEITRIIAHNDSQGLETSDFIIATDGRNVTQAQLKIGLENNPAVSEDNRLLPATCTQIIRISVIYKLCRSNGDIANEY